MSEALSIIIQSLVNWIHLLATVLWVGGTCYTTFILVPSLRKTLEPPVMGKVMSAIMKRFRTMVYISIGLVVVTGAVIQYMSEKFAGMTLGDFWTVIIIVKHIIILIVVIIGVYVMEGLAPKIEKLAPKGPSPEMQKLQKKQEKLGKTNFFLLMIVLILTGISIAA